MAEKQKTVFVGMSGGVDSALSAALLKDAEYNVVGVFIKPWQPDFIPCTWRKERNDAQTVAAYLDIPFRTFDASYDYKRYVADIFIREYAQGRTPNPDVLCNQAIKFGAFLDFAIQNGADMIATGHYARVLPMEQENERTREARNPNIEIRNKKEDEFLKEHSLLTGVDIEKDQSYFLWTLTQYQLAHTIFPVGNMTKAEVRDEARRRNLPVAEKKDSQGVCFLGDISMKDFLSHYIDVEKGNVLNESGEIIGTHEGALLYTIGERHGFTVTKKTPSSGPHFVLSKDLKANTLKVSEISPNIAIKNKLVVEIKNTHWIGEVPSETKTYQVRFRYRQALVPCTISTHTNTATITILEGGSGAVSGQSAVLYDGDTCIGGGVIH